ncbi:FAD-dependent oxidoreductase [Micromonospora sp. NPDC049204]|uniref:FAD-dependent oxidoreductase n=1 Tax=Micromonospora sp. NPDC049204 TaxID=3154351 RepID=UPI0033BFF84F
MTTTGDPGRRDVVVAGAGPVGLFLAGDLARHGVTVTVLEQRTAPHTESRASTLHAHTMELLAGREVLPLLGDLPEGGPGHFGGIRLDLAAGEAGHPYAGQWKCPQTHLESVLATWAVAAGVDIRRGAVVTGLREHDEGVEIDYFDTRTGPARIAAGHLAGCDGERSTVRQLGGFSLTGPTTGTGRELLRADVDGIDVPGRRFERTPRGMATAVRWPDGATRIMVHRFGAASRWRTGPVLYTELAETWAEVTGEDIGHGTPRWVNAFDDVGRQAAEYVRGRVVLAGDAAHQQLPAGGQALNLGLHDAAELGPRLAARARGDAGDSVLAGYDRIRRAAGARTLTHIRVQADLLLGDPGVEGLRSVFTELIQLDAARDHLARAVGGLDLTALSDDSEKKGVPA